MKNKNTDCWWDNLSNPEFGSHSYIQAELALSGLLRSVINSDNSEPLLSFKESGVVATSNEQTLKAINSIEGKIVFKEFKTSYINRFIVWPNGAASITFCKNTGNINVSCYSSSEKDISKIKKFADEHIKQPSYEGHVYAIASFESDKFELVSLGVGGISFEKDNYSKEVVEGFDYIVNEYSSKTPNGRIVLLEGPPGTGKTFFVRGLINAISNATFVTIPPGALSALTSPQFVPMLLQEVRDNDIKGPIVLIVEDADEALVVRKNGNLAAISAILNLGDGIFGSIFDIRIVATTNAKKVEMDEAVLREGRLCKRVEVGNLDYNQAEKLLKKLLESAKDENIKPYKPSFNSATFKSKGVSLAKVYATARKFGWKPKSE